MIVADFSTPVRIPRSTFEELITRIDTAVGEHGVALSLHEDFPFRSLDPVNPTAIDFTGLDIEDDPLDIVENLDQLIYFAFELASSEDVISWAKEYNSDLEAEAVERVELIRKKMPHLELLWSWLESRQLREPPGSRLAAAYKEHRSELSPADELVSALRFHIGRWVAVRGSEVLTSAESARDVITFLRERKLYADSVFRVPRSGQSQGRNGRRLRLNYIRLPALNESVPRPIINV